MTNEHLQRARAILDNNPVTVGPLDQQLKGATERLYGVVRQMLEYLEELDRERES